MKAYTRFLCVLSLTTFCVACGGGSGGGFTVLVPQSPPTDTAGLDSRIIYSTFLGCGVGSAIAVDALGNAYVAGDAFSTDLAATPGAFQTTLASEDDAFVAKLAPDGSLVYLTFLGGGSFDEVVDIAVDDTGHAVVTGHTQSDNFPTANAVQSVRAGDWDVFVTKLVPDGSDLVFSTYLGGNAQDNDAAVAIDAAGDIYLAGGTFSFDFPVTPTGFQQAKSQDRDLFMAKISSDGFLIYSTFLGGTEFDGQGNDIAVDNFGNAYVFTETASLDFPTTLGVVQPNFGGGFSDYAVVKLSPNGSELIYSTYLGGSRAEQPRGPAGIAIDDTGHAYVTGTTNSSDFPLVNAYQSMRASFEDAIIAKLSPTADELLFSTYLGGPNPGTPDSQACCLNFSHAIAVDSNGSAYVAGHTDSPDFPVVNPLAAAAPTTFDQSDPDFDAFVSKFSPDGSMLVFSSRIGASLADFGEAMTIDSNGDIYMTGTAFAGDFPRANALQGCRTGGSGSPFVIRISNP